MDFAWDEPDQSTTTDSNGRDTAAQSRVSTLAGDFGLSSEIFNPLTDLNAPDGQKADEKKKKKPKSEAIKLDSTLLLSEKGFPKLRADVEKMRFKAKYSKDEDAIRDLSRLMNCYQIWAHGLYPKFAFTDAVDKIEKLCHERRMKVHAEEWRKFERRKMRGELLPEDLDPKLAQEDDMWPSADASLPENGGVFGQGFFPDENRPPTPPPSSAFAHAPLSPGTVARIEQSRLQALARLEARKAARLAEDEERRRREAEEEAAMRADEEATRAMGDDDDMRADEEAAREMEAAMRADEEAARDVEAAMRVDEEERRQDGGAGGHRAGHGDASLPGSHHPVPNDTSAAMKRAREALARGEHVSPDDMMQLMMADDDVDGGNAGATSGEWDAVGKLGSKAPMDEDEMFM